MGWKISMILVKGTISEAEKINFVKKYYRSFEKKETKNVLDSVLMPYDSIYIGEYNNATIITNFDIPYYINDYSGELGTFEKKHPICSKLLKTFPKNEIFCIYWNDINNTFGYTAFSNGLRTRYKNNFINHKYNMPSEMVKEKGGLLEAEQNYYAYSRVLRCEPGDEKSVIKDNIIMHINMFFEREYYLNIGTGKEIRTLNEYQCAHEVIMDISKEVLGKRLDLLHLETIPMVEYSS